MQNEKFWVFVKQMVIKYKTPVKPCKFYTENKKIVDSEYRKYVSTTKFHKQESYPDMISKKP